MRTHGHFSVLGFSFALVTALLSYPFFVVFHQNSASLFSRKMHDMTLEAHGDADGTLDT